SATAGASDGRSGDWESVPRPATGMRPERQRQTTQPDEDRDREGDHHRGEREILQRTHVAGGIGADEDEHRDRGDESKPLQRYAEQRDRQQRDADRPQVKPRHRLAIERKRAQRNDRPEHDKQRAHERREHGRSHAMHVAKPVLLRKKHEAAADRDEDQPRPEILRRTDAHHWIPESTRRVGKGAFRIVVETHAGACAVPTRHSGRRAKSAWARFPLPTLPIRINAQSGRMFAFWTIARKRSASCFTRASNSAALEGMVSTPPPAKRSFTSGILRILTTSALSLSMTGCGVALGANSAVQLEASTSFTPSCCNVGHAGLSVERLPIVTASTRTRPLLTCGATEELASTPSGISPAASAAAAGAPPL